MSPGKTTVVALFVRPPIPGRVKTRLAAGLGDEEACCLYRALVTDILGQIKGSGLPLHLFHDDADPSELPDDWRDAAIRIRPQRGEDIGRRMASAFADCFAAGIDRVILVGSDLPDLDTGVLLQAEKALDSVDAVLNPVADGGYCLIALRRDSFRPELFAGIPWSTDRVFARSLRRLRACALSVAVLPVLRDIDTINDLRAYRQCPSPSAVATNRIIGELLD